MIIVIAGTAALYQALHFELDVFNRLNSLRYRAMRVAHSDAFSVRREYRSVVASDFRPLSETTPIPVPFQTADLSLRYGPKRFYVRQGSLWNDQMQIHETGSFIPPTDMVLELLSAHNEYTRLYFPMRHFWPKYLITRCDATSFIGDAGSYMPRLSCEFVDPP